MTRLFDSLQTSFVILAVVVGLLAGQIPWIAGNAIQVVVPALVAMLWSVFLHVPLRRMGAAFGNVHFTGLSLGINFLWTPIFAYALGWLLLHEQPDLWLGLIMLLVTLCTDWYLIFTSLAGDNVRLSVVALSTTALVLGMIGRRCSAS